MRNELAVQDTPKHANSTIGKAKSFHGVQKAMKRSLSGVAVGWKRRNCCFDGLPLPTNRWLSELMVPLISFNSPTFSVVFSWFSTCTGDLAIEDPFCSELNWSGCGRCHFVSGDPKTVMIKVKPRTATFNHQKLRHPTVLAIGPAIIGPT